MTGSMVANNVAMARVHQADTSGLMVSVFTLILVTRTAARFFPFHRPRTLPMHSSASPSLRGPLFRWRRPSLALLLSVCLTASVVGSLVGCDVQHIQELEEGVSTEVDVRQRFGQPEAIWDGPGGERIFEYNRQPAGHTNYMIGIGPDGKMSSLRQVLNPDNFARIEPGMPMETVRRMLGRPMKITTFERKQETHYDWRYRDGPNTGDSKVFTVIFTPDLRVKSTQSVADPEVVYGSGR
jgi:hypothetical protein